MPERLGSSSNGELSDGCLEGLKVPENELSVFASGGDSTDGGAAGISTGNHAETRHRVLMDRRYLRGLLEINKAEILGNDQQFRPRSHRVFLSVCVCVCVSVNSFTKKKQTNPSYSMDLHEIRCVPLICCKEERMKFWW